MALGLPRQQPEHVGKTVQPDERVAVAKLAAIGQRDDGALAAAGHGPCIVELCAGQILTGNADEANVDGLSIKYGGSATGSVGTIKLTLGVAELYSRAAFNITDSIDGYLAFKQDSIESSMTRYDTQISEMEARLDLKREMLLSRYAAMETAMNKLTSQSNWLAGQTEAAAKGWQFNN